MKLKTLLAPLTIASALLAGALLSGCVVVNNSTTQTAKDGSRTITHTRAIAFGDSRTTVGNVRNGVGTNGWAGTSAAAVDNSTSASNAAPIISAVVQGAVQAAIAAAAKPVVP